MTRVLEFIIITHYYFYIRFMYTIFNFTRSTKSTFSTFGFHSTRKYHCLTRRHTYTTAKFLVKRSLDFEGISCTSGLSWLFTVTHFECAEFLLYIMKMFLYSIKPLLFVASRKLRNRRVSAILTSRRFWNALKSFWLKCANSICIRFIVLS